MELVELDPAHAIATDGGMLVCVWRTQTTMAAVETVVRTASTIAQAHHGRMVMLTVVERTAELPAAAVRQRLSALFKQLGTAVVCSALVFEGQGFRAATVRGITISINMLAKQPFPHRVFATAADAAGWLAGHAQVEVSDTRLLHMVRVVRDALDGETSVFAAGR